MTMEVTLLAHHRELWVPALLTHTLLPRDPEVDRRLQ